MFEDIVNSIKATLYERAVSPLFGAFLLSWGITNYKLVLVILSSMDVIEKIAHIECQLYPDVWAWIFGMVVFPLIGVAFIIFAYPIPAKFVFKHWRDQQRKLRIIKQEIEGNTPLTIEESRVLKGKHDEIVNRYEMEIGQKERDYADLESKNEKYRNEIDQLRSTISNLTKDNFTESDEGYNDKIKLLLMLSDQKEIEVNKIVEDSGIKKDRCLYELGELRDKGFIQLRTPTDGNEFYQIVQKGRKKLAAERKI